MKKRDFYLKALALGAYLTTAWNIACYSLVAESPEDWKKNPYPFRLVQLPNAHYFVNPDNTEELVLIEDSKPGQPLFVRNELIELDVGDLPNVYTPVKTTYGNTLANQILLVRPFENKIPFITGRISIKKIEKILEERIVESSMLLTGDLNAKSDPLHAPISVDEYISFCDGAFSLVAYTQIYTPADTYKTMTSPPGIEKLRDMLIKANEGQLHDRAVVADILSKLQKADADYLKGDRGGEDFLIWGKAKPIVRSRLFLMYGAETGIEEKVDVDLIQKSLAEGWDISKFPAMNDALRAGSYNRGKQTELGGEAVKDLFRASGNISCSLDDCGTTVGVPTIIHESDMERYLGGRTIIEKNVNTKITRDNIGTYLGRVVNIRSPMTCKGSGTDYCKICLGDRLANNESGLSAAVADYGSVFLYIFMSAAHSKGVQVQKLDIKRQLM